MKTTRLLLLLLRTRHRSEKGFGLILALLVALVTVLSAVTLFQRTQSGMLGVAQESESRLAREAAEAGLTRLISELNLPANRRLLVSAVPFTKWGEWKASKNASVANPCFATSQPNGANALPSDSLIQLVDAEKGEVALGTTPNQRFRTAFVLKTVELSNGDRSIRYRTSRDITPPEINDTTLIESQINFNNAANVGHIELVVEGRVYRRNGPDDVIARANLSREYVVVPKCCQRSLGGPGQMFGNDFRWCNGMESKGYPALVVGLANTMDSRMGGLYVRSDTTPELAQRTQPGEEPLDILCRLPLEAGDSRCEGEKEVDGVKVITTTLKFPKLPTLGSNGLPCKEDDQACLNGPGPSGAYSIELFNHNNGAATNSASDAYAKDYLRVNASSKNVEICNKTYSPPGSPGAAKTADESPDGKATIDTTQTIVPGSCTNLAPYCSRLTENNFDTYHCRISNIYANDFGATNDKQVRHNNTLFIDTSNGPIYLYVYDKWAKKTVRRNDPIYREMLSFGYYDDRPVSNFAPIYTVGGYNDGQILHVYCPDNANTNNVCVEPAEAAQQKNKAPSNMTRAEIISDLEDPVNNDSKYSALIGDDGFVRDLFFWMPNASFRIAGDPRILDLYGDVPMGKPQVSAGLWLNELAFVRRTSQLYLPSPKDNYFPFLLSPQDRNRAVIHDWVARSASITSLFHLLQ